MANPTHAVIVSGPVESVIPSPSLRVRSASSKARFDVLEGDTVATPLHRSDFRTGRPAITSTNDNLAGDVGGSPYGDHDLFPVVPTRQPRPITGAVWAAIKWSCSPISQNWSIFVTVATGVGFVLNYLAVRRYCNELGIEPHDLDLTVTDHLLASGQFILLTAVTMCLSMLGFGAAAQTVHEWRSKGRRGYVRLTVVSLLVPISIMLVWLVPGVIGRPASTATVIQVGVLLGLLVATTALALGRIAHNPGRSLTEIAFTAAFTAGFLAVIAVIVVWWGTPAQLAAEQKLGDQSSSTRLSGRDFEGRTGYINHQCVLRVAPRVYITRLATATTPAVIKVFGSQPDFEPIFCAVGETNRGE